MVVGRSSSRRRATDFLFIVAVAASLSACAGNDAVTPPDPTVPTPVVRGLSAFQASVGDPIDISGDGFLSPDLGWVDMVFSGTFYPDDGAPEEPVELVIPFQPRTDSTIHWEAFGAYRVPFISSGDHTGTFEGHAYAINQTWDGRSTLQPEETWMPLSFTVLPSLIVQDFVAVGDTWIADCRYPTLNALNVLPYAMRIRAIGYDPFNFEYTFSEGLLIDGVVQAATTTLRHVTTPGETEHAVMAQWGPVPENIDGYRASITVRSQGSDGITREVKHNFMVRKPLQVYFRGPYSIAELYEPEVVSSCIPGGPAGVGVTYSETTSETRTRSIQRQVDRGWETSYGEEHSETWGSAETASEQMTASTMVTVSDSRSMEQMETSTDMFSRTDGRTRATNVNFSESASEEYGWNVETETVEDFLRETGGSVTAGGSAGIPLVAEGTVSVTAQGKVGWVDGTRMREGASGSMGTTRGVGFGETEGLSTQEERALSRARGYSWGLTQGYAEANGYSHSNTWSQTRSFNEGLTQSMTLGERFGTSESELLSVSTTTAESLGISATVFAGQYGTWYRQTARLVRFGSVVAYDLCGNGSEIGEVGLDDWAWAPDLGIGRECPPPSNLPAAECRVAPCSGY